MISILSEYIPNYDIYLVLTIWDPGQKMSLSIFYFEWVIKRSSNSFVKKLVLYIIRVLGSLRVKYNIIKVGNNKLIS